MRVNESRVVESKNSYMVVLFPLLHLCGSERLRKLLKEFLLFPIL